MPAMIDITNAEKTFTMHLQGGVQLPVLRNVSFHVGTGECVVLSGPSGTGKSSILKMMFGNYRCDRGRIGVRHQGNIVDLASALNFAQHGDGKILLRFGDLVKDFIIHVIFATDKAIAQRPEALRSRSRTPRVVVAATSAT